MALTEIIRPDSYNFSKNPIVGVVQTSSYIPTPGVESILLMSASTGSGANAVGGTLSLVWATNSVVFTVATTPDDTGYQVRPKAALSDTAFRDQLIEDLKTNFILTENFGIFPYLTTGIAIISRAKNTDFNITFGSTNFGFTLTSNSDAVTTVYAPNYKMQADLYMESLFLEADFTKVASQLLDPLDNKCTFDFQTEINANLSYDIPTYGQTAKTLCRNGLKQFFYRYHERYGSPVNDYKILDAVQGFALKAGVPNQEFPGTSDHMWTKYIDPRKFMTHQPRIKRVTEEQQEYLYFMTNSGNDLGQHLIITVYYRDGSTPTVITESPFGSAAYQVFCIPVGFNALNLSSTAAFDLVSKYTIEIDNTFTSGHKTEKFTYICETDIFIDTHYILFSNSDGGMDTVRFTGVQEKMFDLEMETVQKITLYDTPVLNGQFKEVNKSKKDKFKISSGWLTRSQCLWLEDLFLSEEKYLIDTESEKLLPITISTTTAKEFDSQSNLCFYEIEYELAFTNRAIKSI